MGWSPGQRGVWEQQTYRQRHGYGEYTGPRLSPQTPTAPPSTNIPGLPPAPSPTAQPRPTPSGFDYSRANEWRTATGAAPVDPNRNRTDGRTNVFNNNREMFDYRQWATANPSAPASPAPVAPPSPQPGQNIIQQGLQQILGGGGESDPYEAWKAGGRQGNRPAGY